MADAPNAPPAAQASPGRPIAGAGEAEAVEAVEAVARVICRARGIDPDAQAVSAIPTKRGTGRGHMTIETSAPEPAWKASVPDARRVIAAIPEPPIPAAIERLVARVEASPMETADMLIVRERLREAGHLVERALAVAKVRSAFAAAQAPDAAEARAGEGG